MFSTYIGGETRDHGTSIQIDKNGDIYVAGYTSSSDTFPIEHTIPGYDKSFNGGWTDNFLVKLSEDGSRLLYSTYIGGEADEYEGIKFYAHNELIYIASTTDSTETNGFPIGGNIPGDYQVNDTSIGFSKEGYFLVLNTETNTLVYSTYIGGQWGEWIYDIGFVNTNEIVIAGDTASSKDTGFPIGGEIPGFETDHNPLNSNAFVMKFSLDVDQNPVVNDPSHIIQDVEYINQCEDTKDEGFNKGSVSCGATTSVMLVNYYDRLPSLADYPNATSKGYFVGNSYESFGFKFNAQNNSCFSDGAFGYIHNADDYAVHDWAESYFVKHGLYAHKFDCTNLDESWVEIKNAVDNNTPLYTRGGIDTTGNKSLSGHVVLVTGYREVEYANGDRKRNIIVHDPFWSTEVPWWSFYTKIVEGMALI